MEWITQTEMERLCLVAKLVLENRQQGGRSLTPAIQHTQGGFIALNQQLIGNRLKAPDHLGPPQPTPQEMDNQQLQEAEEAVSKAQREMDQKYLELKAARKHLTQVKSRIFPMTVPQQGTGQSSFQNQSTPGPSVSSWKRRPGGRKGREKRRPRTPHRPPRTYRPPPRSPRARTRSPPRRRTRSRSPPRRRSVRSPPRENDLRNEVRKKDRESRQEKVPPQQKVILTKSFCPSATQVPQKTQEVPQKTQEEEAPQYQKAIQLMEKMLDQLNQDLSSSSDSSPENSPKPDQIQNDQTQNELPILNTPPNEFPEPEIQLSVTNHDVHF